VTRTHLLRAYAQHYNPSLARLFGAACTPVEDSASGATVFTTTGEAYLDFACGHGVFAVGHRNAAVQHAVLRQIGTLATAPPLLGNEPRAKLLSRLARLLPPGLDRIELAGSGTEAVEIALRTARLARPGRRALVAAIDSYHGKTLGALAVMGQPHLRAPFGALWPPVAFVPHGDAEAAARAIKPGTLAVVLEPILGGGSLSVPPDGYLARVRERCDEVGALLIVDEVQTGFGRTGTMFAFERDGIVPDMVILSKAMTGGHVPIAAVAVRRELETDPLERPSDSAGSPLVCAAAAAAIDYIVEHELTARAERMGHLLLTGLEEIAAAHPELVHDARGRGLMTGLRLRNQLVENALWLQLLKRRVVVALSLSNASKPVLRFYPPLVVEPAQIDRFLETLDASLRELGRFPPRVYDVAGRSLRLQHWMPASVLRLGARLIA